MAGTGKLCRCGKTASWRIQLSERLVDDAAGRENDDERQLHWAADWFVEHLGPNVPWHFTAFHPDFKMLDKPPTTLTMLELARAIARSKGLRYVYTGNVHDPVGSSTRCPQCLRVLIEREGYAIGAWKLEAGHCRFCG